jgi:DNA-binding transcriptional regulator YiaG
VIISKIPRPSAGDHQQQNARLAYTKRELAELLSVSQKTITRWEERKLIKSLKACRKKLYPAAIVNSFLKETL